MSSESKSKNYCSVPFCNNYKTSNYSLHRFPSDKNLKTKWAVALKIGKPVTKGMMVCSEHFKKSDFFPKTMLQTRSILKNGVIPSQKIPKRRHDKVFNRERVIAREQRAKKRVINVCMKTILEEEKETEDYASGSKDISENLDMHENLIVQTFLDKEVQVNTFSEFVKFDIVQHILASDKSCKIYLGINIQIFETIKNCSLSFKSNFADNLFQNLPLKMCITFMKLKHNMTFVMLGLLTGLSNTTIARYFHETVQLLSKTIKSAIYWPTTEENKASMPKCFENFTAVKVVIDATEISVQKRKCLKCRLRTYSHYKKGHTVKFLICIAPCRVISYISKAYGGRVSDKAIFTKENIISLMENYIDAIMVDKGVLIDTECDENAVRLIRPPFLRQKQQFTEAEAKETASIARARVHVERVIQRLKLFKIFTNKIEWSLLPYITDCMIVACAAVNLSAPILAKDKF